MKRFKTVAIRVKKRLKSLTPLEIFILVTVAFSVVFLVRYFGIRKEWRTIRVEVVGRNWSSSYSPYGYKTPFWLSDKLNVGLIEKDAGGKTIAKVIDIESYERGDEEAEVYLTVKVESFFNKRMEKYVFKGRALELGAPIELRLGNILVLGQIIDDDVPLGSYEEKEVIVVGRWIAQEPWIVAQVKKGDTMINRATGEVVAEILDVKIEPSTSNMFISNPNIEGYVAIEKNPRLRDIVITLKLKLVEIDKRWYFGGHQKVKVGEQLWFYTDRIDGLATIQEIQPIE